MFCVTLAELCICIENKYSYIERLCKNYITTDAEPEFCVSATNDEISAEDDGGGYGKEYLESLAIYRKIAEKLADYDGFLMHGVVLEVEKNGVAFLAKSGVGKSTHSRLWLGMENVNCRIINGDKPLVRLKNGIPFAYGTPWAGKEGLETNAGVPLKKICFLERAEKNSCEKLEKNRVFAPLLNQVHFADNRFLGKIIDKIEKLVEFADFYVIRCNINPDAAETAYKTIFKEDAF